MFGKIQTYLMAAFWLMMVVWLIYAILLGAGYVWGLDVRGPIK